MSFDFESMGCLFPSFSDKYNEDYTRSECSNTKYLTSEEMEDSEGEESILQGIMSKYIIATDSF